MVPMGPWRVGILVGEFPKASETFILSHINALLERGHDVWVLARARSRRDVAHAAYDRSRIEPRTTLLDKSAFAGGRLGRRACQLVHGIANVSTWWRAVRAGYGIKQGVQMAALADIMGKWRKEQLDVLHCHFGVHGVFGNKLNRTLGIARRVITTFHGFDVNTQRAQRMVDYKELFGRGDRFTANTRFTANRLASLGCPSDRIDIWPMGIDTAAFRFAERTRPTNGEVRIVTVARVVPKKGIDVTIEALGLLARAGYRAWRYQIVGEGGPAAVDELRRLAAKWGIEDRIEIAGACSDKDVRRILAEAHLFVLASRTAPDGDMEGQGVVLQEAQACGLPVITTRHNGIPEGVLEGESAVLVPENDAMALAQAIEGVAQSPGRWSAMGRMGRRFVEGKYDVSKTTDILESIYQRLGCVGEAAA